MRKPDLCIRENKDADQLHSNCAADQRLCFCYIDSEIPLVLKSDFYAPNFEKVGSILLLACPCVRPSICLSVQKKFKARVLKFHILIPRQKIAYM